MEIHTNIIFISGIKESSKATSAIRYNRFIDYCTNHKTNFSIRVINYTEPKNQLDKIKLIFLLFRKLINEDKGVIYLSGSPFYIFILSYFRFFSKKFEFILEYRDPWFGDVMRESGFIRNSFVFIVELLCCINARKIILISEKILQINPLKLISNNRNKFIIIPTEFDVDAINAQKSRRIKSINVTNKVIGHFGNVDILMSIEPTLNIIKINPEHTFKFYGIFDSVPKKIFEDASLKNIIFNERVDVLEAYKLMGECYALLLMGSSTNQRLHRKLLEYIYFEKPIWYLGSVESPTYIILNNYTNLIEVRNSIFIFYNFKKNMKDKFIKTYGSKNVFKKVLNEILS